MTAVFVGEVCQRLMLTMTVCVPCGGFCALFILGYLVYHAAPPLLDFFTKLPTPVGESGGGMANAILGSAKLLFLASVFGVPIGFFGGVYLSEFSGHKVAFWSLCSHLLNGFLPSSSASSLTRW